MYGSNYRFIPNKKMGNIEREQREKMKNTSHGYVTSMGEVSQACLECGGPEGAPIHRGKMVELLGRVMLPDSNRKENED